MTGERPLFGPRIGVFGTFDTGEYGDILLPLIFEREMRRHIPSVALTFYAPMGWRRAIAMKGGEIPEPFGAWSESRCAELAGALDLAVISGDITENRFFLDAIGELPTLWNAVGVPFELDERSKPALQKNLYISVRDERSRERVEALGIDQKVHVVPDTRLLVADLFPCEVLERRIRQLRAIGVDPDDPIALSRLGDSATVEDFVAVQAFGADQADSRDALSAHFDRIAEIAERCAARRSGMDVAELQRREIASLTSRNETLRLAHQALRERAAQERVLFAETVNRFEEGDLSPAALASENARLLRDHADERHGRMMAEQRAAGLESRLEAVRDENRRHKLVLGTRLVSLALRVQQWLARMLRRR